MLCTLVIVNGESLISCLRNPSGKDMVLQKLTSRRLPVTVGSDQVLTIDLLEAESKCIHLVNEHPATR